MKNYAHQDKIIQKNHTRRGLFLGTGCIHPDTAIYDPVLKNSLTVKERFELGVSFHVWSKNNSGKLVIAKALPPVVYPKTRLLLFCFSNGASISVTPEHRFWNGKTYVKARSLVQDFEKHALPTTSDSSFLPQLKSVSSPLLSTSVLSQLKLFVNVRHYWQKVLNYLSYYFLCHHQRGQQLLLDLNISLSFFPSRAGVPVPYFDDFCKDDLEHKQEHIHFYQLFSRLSMKNFFHLGNNVFSNVFRHQDDSSGTTQHLSLFPFSFLLHSCSYLFYTIVKLLQHLFLLVSSIKINTKVYIKEVKWEQTGIEYYDFHVPVYENYLAGGVINHNSGKSRIAALLSKGQTLVICPKTVRDKKHWEEEWVNKAGLKLSRLTVMSKEDFKKAWGQNEKFFYKFETVIGDEAHQLGGVYPATSQRNYIKYPKTSLIYHQLHDMLSKTRPHRVYMLTATPTSQPMVVWGLASLLGYKWDYFQFRNTFYWEKSRNIWIKKKGPKYKKILAGAVNHIGDVGRLQDWFDVPEQTYKVFHVEPTKEQEAYLPQLQMLYPDPLVQLLKRHQLEQGIFEKGHVPENKTKAIRQYLNEFEKIVIYARYTAQIERLARSLRIGHTVYVLKGDTKNRKKVLEDAERNPQCVLIIQAQISEGYQLPSFPCVIYASEFGFVHRRQSEGRVLRADRLKKNLYVTLLCGAADARMRQAVETGEEFDDEVHALNISKNKNI